MAALRGLALTPFLALASPALGDDGHGLARDMLKNVPVFFIADTSGAPAETTADGSAFYLTRQQASIALGLARGGLAPSAFIGEELHVEVIDLSRAARFAGEHHFVKPASRIEAADRMDTVPLFLVRDADGAPFTVKGEDSRRRVYFYLSEADAQAFMARVMGETGRSVKEIRLSIVTLESVLDSILNSPDPLVQNWAIWASAETRMDAADLRSEARLDVGSLAE